MPSETPSFATAAPRAVCLPPSTPSVRELLIFSACDTRGERARVLQGLGMPVRFTSVHQKFHLIQPCRSDSLELAVWNEAKHQGLLERNKRKSSANSGFSPTKCLSSIYGRAPKRTRTRKRPGQPDHSQQHKNSLGRTGPESSHSAAGRLAGQTNKVLLSPMVINHPVFDFL